LARSIMRSAACLVCLVLLLRAAPAGAATAPPPQAADRLASGDAAVSRLDLEGALTAYRAALAAAPESYEATWKLARALTDKATLTGDPARQKALCVEAVELARHAVELEPADSRGHDYLAIAVGKLALLEGGKRKVELSKEVKAQAEAALQCDSDDDLALHVLGIWNRELSELPWVLRKLAGLLYGKLPEASLPIAIADLERATTLHPEVIPHHVELGITLAAARRFPEARTELQKALAMPTGWVTDDYYRGLARRELARVEAHLD
jgi:tetratricopeptide (TPR) repeat protein